MIRTIKKKNENWQILLKSLFSKQKDFNYFMREVKIFEDSIKINSGEILRLRKKIQNLDEKNKEINLQYNNNRKNFKNFLNLNKNHLYEINKNLLIEKILNISMVK